jgi:hypothetical protein
MGRVREESDDNRLSAKTAGACEHLFDQILMPAMHPVKNTDGRTSFFQMQFRTSS